MLERLEAKKFLLQIILVALPYSTPLVVKHLKNVSRFNSLQNILIKCFLYHTQRLAIKF